AYGQLVSTSDQVAKEGDNEVVISCTYSNDASEILNMKWDEVNKDGAIITSGIVNDIQSVNGRYALRTKYGKADLVISKPIRNDNQRKFLCEIQLFSGKYIYPDHPSNLTVYYLDEPVLRSSANSVFEDQLVILNCSKPDGDPVPNYITWYKDGKALNTKDTSRFATSEDEHKIRIDPATRTDGGLYTCKAESDIFRGNDSKTSNQIDLKVIYLDDPVLNTSASSASEGKSVILTCRKPDGYPVPSISWYKDGQTFDTTDTTRFITSEEAIIIKSATADDGGNYMCKAVSDEKDGKPSNTIPLKIKRYDFIFRKSLEVTEVISYDNSKEIFTKYRPSIARFEKVQWDLIVDSKKIPKGEGNPPTLCSSTTYFFNHDQVDEQEKDNDETETMQPTNCTISNGTIRLKLTTDFAESGEKYVCTIHRHGYQCFQFEASDIEEATCGEDVKLKFECVGQSPVLEKVDGTYVRLNPEPRNTDKDDCFFKISKCTSKDAGKYWCSSYKDKRRIIMEKVLKVKVNNIVVATCGDNVELKWECGGRSSEHVLKKVAEKYNSLKLKPNLSLNTDGDNWFFKIPTCTSKDAGIYQCSFYKDGKKIIIEKILKGFIEAIKL
ncbi:hemicentin-2-like, partial [Anneissia japonica]|uniref:hemicentin-2-like n=1 Tax=Anneissia japonica TaxID=1529436 RepID=UPI0014256D6E